jgi:hypothetical protein
LEGGPPRFRPRFTRVVLLRYLIGRSCSFVYGTIALYGARFHALRLPHDLVTPARAGTPWAKALQPRVRNGCPLTRTRFGLFRFRSPLLAESRLISFPPGTEMFQFPGLPPHCLCIQQWVTPYYQRWVSPFGHPRIIACSAAPRGFSQPSTSFFGSWCQGIHHVPLTS